MPSLEHPHLEDIAHQIAAVFEPLAHPLVLLSNVTGQRWGIVSDPDLFWFRPAGFHIFEALFFGPFLYTLWLWYGIPCTQKLLSSNNSNTHHGGGRSSGNNKLRLPARNAFSPTPNVALSKPAFASDIFFGIIMLICYAAQVFFKATRVNPLIQLFWMAVPCHVITLTWAYVLLSPPSWRNYNTCRFIGALLCMSSWGGWAASAFPDWSDHQYWIEGPMFYIHHGALLVMPHYWAAKHGMLRLTQELFWTYIVIALGINFFIYTPMSYISGVNVNYNLHPHLKMGVKTKWYRFLAPTALAIWGLMYWYFTYFVNEMYYKLFVSASSGGRNITNSYEVITPIYGTSRNTSISPPASASPPDNNNRFVTPTAKAAPKKTTNNKKGGGRSGSAAKNKKKK